MNISVKVKDFYLADQELSMTTASQLIDAISDSSYAHPIDTSGKVMNSYLKFLLKLFSKIFKNHSQRSFKIILEDF